MGQYDSSFYSVQMDGSGRSAQIIVPLVLAMLVPLQISSVIDFGCGVGGWLAQFMNEGCEDVLGLDFGEADPSQMLIPSALFRKADLSKRMQLKKRYDLSMSLEVAEHIPPRLADTFVANLCGCSDLVLFSAAVKGQGGIGHINEQPLGYWIKKFEQLGYGHYDFIRPKIWNDRNIEVWYRQNMLLFANKKLDMKKCAFMEENISLPVDVAHPQMVEELRKSWDQQLRSRLINPEYVKEHDPKIYRLLHKLNHSFKRR